MGRKRVSHYQGLLGGKSRNCVGQRIRLGGQKTKEKKKRPWGPKCAGDKTSVLQRGVWGRRPRSFSMDLSGKYRWTGPEKGELGARKPKRIGGGDWYRLGIYGLTQP